RRQGCRGRDAPIVVGPIMTTGDDAEPRVVDSGVRRRTRPRRRGGRVTIVIFILVMVPLLVVGSGLVCFWWELGGESSGAKAVVHLELGWGVPRIADELARKHVVRSSFAFNLYARMNGENSFQAGTYELRENLGAK